MLKNLPSPTYAVAMSLYQIRIKRNNDLCTFQLHFIIDFVLTEWKLAHDPVKFPVHSISNFVMNIIMAKTGSTTKVDFAK